MNWRIESAAFHGRSSLNRRWTISFTKRPSARPFSRGMSCFITLPKSPRPVAPVSAITCWTRAVISPSPICCGRYFPRMEILLVPTDRLPVNSTKHPVVDHCQKQSLPLQLLLFRFRLFRAARVILITARAAFPSGPAFMACTISFCSRSFKLINHTSFLRFKQPRLCGPGPCLICIYVCCALPPRISSCAARSVFRSVPCGEHPAESQTVDIDA